MDNNSYKIINKHVYGGMFVDKYMLELDAPRELSVIVVPREVWEKYNIGDIYSPQQSDSR